MEVIPEQFGLLYTHTSQFVHVDSTLQTEKKNGGENEGKERKGKRDISETERFRSSKSKYDMKNGKQNHLIMQERL